MKTNSIIHILRRMDVTDLSGEKVMVDFENGKYYMIQGSGNAIWDLMEDGTTPDSIIKTLLTEYDITEEQCTEEVLGFLSRLARLGIIEVR